MTEKQRIKAEANARLDRFLEIISRSTKGVWHVSDDDLECFQEAAEYIEKDRSRRARVGKVAGQTPHRTTVWRREGAKQAIEQVSCRISMKKRGSDCDWCVMEVEHLHSEDT